MMNLLPFGSLDACPACGRDPYSTSMARVVYSTDVKVDAGNGRFVAVTMVSDRPVPHLERHCGCGYGWLEQVKDPDSVLDDPKDVVGLAGLQKQFYDRYVSRDPH